MVDAMLAAAKGYMSYEQMAARSDDEDEAQAAYRRQLADIESRQ